MADAGSDEEMARLMGRINIRRDPVARPAAPVPVRRIPRAALFEAAPVYVPRFNLPAARPQGVKRKLDRMQRGNGKKICPKCHGYM